MPLPLVFQRLTYDCGVACCYAILRCFNIGSKNYWKIYQQLGTTKSGTSPNQIINFFNRKGFKTRELYSPSHKFLMRNTNPLLCLIQYGPKVSSHWVILLKVTRRYVTMQDPWYGIVRIPYQDFLQIWYDPKFVNYCIEVTYANDSLS